jgi:hypothetical protein
MLLYIRIVVFTGLLLVEFGVVAPELMSAKDTLSVVFGVLSILVVSPILFIIGSRIYKEIEEKFE